MRNTKYVAAARSSPPPELRTRYGLIFARNRGLRQVTEPGHPFAPAGDDVGELVADDAAEAVVDRAQEAEGDEDPGLGVRVAGGDDSAFGLGAADHVGDELVHLAHLEAQGPPDLRVVRGLRQRLDPEVDEDDPSRRPGLEVGLADRLDPVRRVRLTLERPLPENPHLFPDAVQAGEVQLSLRGEVAVENGLGDAGLAGDLRRGRAVVAALGEDLAGGLDDRPFPLRPGETAHAAASRGRSASSAWR